MGRPYKNELDAMENTYKFINSLDVSVLYAFFQFNANIPMLIIGSGGSFAVAKIFELCYQKYGGFAKAITPYELKNENQQIGKVKILIVTAGGNNPDTVGAYDYVRRYEPFELCVICTSLNSKIAKGIKKNNDAILFETSIPFGKDGYLAVNSSVAMFTIVKRILEKLENSKKHKIIISPPQEGYPSIEKMENIDNFIVLYGGWGAPAAYDLESKCSEAGLMSLQFVDYRNFAHGRHNWIDKNKDSTMIVALVTPEDKVICKKTLQKMPMFLPVISYETKKSGSSAALELLVKVFYFVSYLGELKGIDPGRPHVPEYGSKLYNIKYSLLKSDIYLKMITRNTKESSIYRKLKGIEDKINWYDYYSKRYDFFVKKVCNSVYKALLLDYDGTICDSDGKFKSEVIIHKLNELLQHNIIIGFATGRGDSIIEQLKKNISKSYWKNVIIGYYNGASISALSKIPNFQNTEAGRLKEFYDKASDISPLGSLLVNRECQLSIREFDVNKLLLYYEILNEIKINYNFDGIQIFMSGHAIDIVDKNGGKQRVAEHIKKLCNGSILCIGDEGRLYENDFEMLSENIGLSSKDQNKLGESGWNLAPLGMNSVRATEYYFNKIKVQENSFVLEGFE